MTTNGAEHDPHLLLSARIADHPKIIALPSDKARWGWVTILSAAKLQRPPGRFANLAVLRKLAGEYCRFLEAYAAVGLTEAGEDGTIVVHDWATHQERRSRAQMWRDDRGLTSGHQSLEEGSGETTGKRIPTVSRGNTRTAALSQSPSQSPSELVVEGGAGGGDDALDVYHRISGTFPSGNAKTWIEQLAGEFGESAAGDAIAAEWATGPRHTILQRTQNRLRSTAKRADRQERADEKVRVVEKRRPDPTVAALKAALEERYGPGETA